MNLRHNKNIRAEIAKFGQGLRRLGDQPLTRVSDCLICLNIGS